MVGGKQCFTQENLRKHYRVVAILMFVKNMRLSKIAKGIVNWNLWKGTTDMNSFVFICFLMGKKTGGYK